MTAFIDKLRIFKRICARMHLDGDLCLLPWWGSIDPDHYCRVLPTEELGHGRDPHPLFDCRYYRATYLREGYDRHPFHHYMTQGYKKRYRPGPYFDYDIFTENTGWSPSAGNPLSYYLKKNLKNTPHRSGLFFDLDWYRDNTPILYKTAPDILLDYKTFGALEKKSPTPLFSPTLYLEEIGDEPLAVKDPLAHYLTYGAARDIRPTKWFDPVYYREHYMEENSADLPLENYLREGVKNAHYPNRKSAELPVKPLISIAVPVYNADPCFLGSCIRSVYYQSYPHWELCMVDDGSTRTETREQLLKWKESDPRIKIVFADHNRGISAATNSAAELATGDYIGFLDNDDTLEPDCLYQVARTIAETGADIVYTDEDLIGDDGRRFSLFLKPDFNPALLLSHNYITHFVAVAAPLFDACGGFRSDHDGAQDFDLMLRLSSLTDKIAHIPQVLYHWRASETSTSINHDQKNYAHDAGKKALQKHLELKHIEADVTDTDRNFYYRIKAGLPQTPTVTVFIYHDLSQPVTTDFDALSVTARYAKCNFIVVTEDEAALKNLPGDFDTLLVPAGSPRAKAQHLALSTVSSDYSVFLDTTITTAAPGWLHELVTVSLSQGCNIVCSRVDPGNGIPSYSVPDISNPDPVYFLDFLQNRTTHLNGLFDMQHVSLPCWNTCLIERQLYFDLGGFDSENFPHMFAMADLAYRAEKQGIQAIYTPYAHAIGTKKAEDGDTERREEKKRFQQKWTKRLIQDEPYYNRAIPTVNHISREAFNQWLSGRTQEEIA